MRYTTSTTSSSADSPTWRTCCPLCTRHHHLVHDLHWTLELDEHHTLTIRTADGHLHATVPLDATKPSVVDHTIHTDPNTTDPASGSPPPPADGTRPPDRQRPPNPPLGRPPDQLSLIA